MKSIIQLSDMARKNGYRLFQEKRENDRWHLQEPGKLAKLHFRDLAEVQEYFEIMGDIDL